MIRRTPALVTGLAALVAAALAAVPAQASSAPGYTTYQKAGAAARAGEPSVGVSWRSGAFFLQAGLQTEKVTPGPKGTSTWEDVAGKQTSLRSLDPIGFLDGPTGRMFVSQLTGVGSLMAFSDDDGKTWTPSQGSGLPAGADHQTVGGGPYPIESGLRPLTTYPHAVYYCSQDIATAFCARSDSGGLTFANGSPIYSLADCGGLHGHVKVAPDGTVYVPNSDCNGHPGVAVSTDAGLTWTVHPLSAEKGGQCDPSIAIGRDGTAYMVWDRADGTAAVSVSRDRGTTWSKSVTVGARAGVMNIVFPEAVAGDGDRAAVSFLGTTTEGRAQNVNFGKNTTKTAYEGAAYHLYVSTTYDRGRTWRTVDVTGKDPVQRGRVCMGGTTCSGGDRNLLDFADATLDRKGYVYVGWADGCTAKCVTSTLVADNKHVSDGRITRQTSGLPLFRSPQPLAS